AQQVVVQNASGATSEVPKSIEMEEAGDSCGCGGGGSCGCGGEEGKGGESAQSGCGDNCDC
ncbi:hypothetical protein M1397_01325, partial [Candidatus Marsarchaeota archaeon]|nr:hypothetical protein [Candidatus Marsarchaeota archaeon]